MSITKTDVFGAIPVIRFSGNYNWTELYRLCRSWIENNRYSFYEKRYKHKGDEVEIEILGERKIDEMYKYYMYVSFHLWNVKEVPVIKNGKKTLRTDGRLEITINGKVEVDYANRFSGKFGERLGKMWFVVTKKDFEMKHVDPLTYDLYNLHKEIKKFLGMSLDSNAY